MEKTDKGIVADLPEACVDEIEATGEVKLALASQLIFVIESFGQIEAKEILIQAIDVLRENLKQVNELNI